MLDGSKGFRGQSRAKVATQQPVASGPAWEVLCY